MKEILSCASSIASASSCGRLILPWAFYHRIRKRRHPAQYNRCTVQNAEQIIMTAALMSAVNHQQAF
jgi:hypothetical protein